CVQDELGVKLVFALLMPPLGMQNAILQIVERVIRVTLSSGHGLLAAERGRHLGGMGARDLDVPTEDARVPHLERRNVRRLPELLLESEDELRAFLLQAARLVELRVVPRAKNPP